ncbi:hypothetical protein RFI_07845 [Reticulomyxa filosa]|uniref:Major facilitator superfamily associated domain-containing protein n=1 Tax=Reticulomyxa filosa TaxID=46433 RepID=X6NVH0_RETFI|nr:hypothetical protein RFI_07845 [Reticulomyxa filosa]|eukprot:ETO29282.1 hypothetical protein RFI_07845 [Reticulomyxa filosa]
MKDTQKIESKEPKRLLYETTFRIDKKHKLKIFFYAPPRERKTCNQKKLLSMAEFRIVVLRAVYFWNACALGVLIRFLIVFLDEINYSPSQIGILVALRPGIGFFASIFWGFLGDYTNRRLTILLVGSILSSFCYTLLLVKKVQENFWYTFAAISVACFLGASMNLLDAICLKFLMETPTKTKHQHQQQQQQQQQQQHQHQHQHQHHLHNHEEDSDMKRNISIKETSETHTTGEQNENGKAQSKKKKDESKTINEASRYGETRLWAAIGWGLGAVACGFLVNLYQKDFIILFYDVCVLLQWLILLLLLPMYIRRYEKKMGLQTSIRPNKQKRAPLLSRYQRRQRPSKVVANEVNPNLVFNSNLSKNSVNVSDTFGTLTPQQSVVQTNVGMQAIPPLPPASQKQSQQASSSNLLEKKVQRTVPYPNDAVFTKNSEWSSTSSTGRRDPPSFTNSPPVISRPDNSAISASEMESLSSYDSRIARKSLLQGIGSKTNVAPFCARLCLCCHTSCEMSLRL